ncbi:unnamed protein product [Anisakis simplex]|uniref:Uncharacterized protein n=1 Tax=Anisakis simplex TaxID=6269 RepID=A0A0M3KDD5_ANISI|nr:unnamed protein product [Anisakis simplex]
MTRVGFEPTPPKRLVPKTSALDRSAISPRYYAPIGFREHEQSRVSRKKKNACDESGIRTHASEETGALNQRLRPLGHLAYLTTLLFILSINRHPLFSFN